MQVKFVFKIFPVFIFRSNFVPNGFIGINIWPVMIIRPTVKAELINEVIIHELVHCRQQLRSLFLFYLLYLLSAKWRMRYECEAYAAQLKTPAAVLTYAGAIHELQDYNLPFKITEIKACLDSYL